MSSATRRSDATQEEADSAPRLSELANSIAHGESLINQRVLDAINVSERAVLRLGTMVGDIVAQAREQVEASVRLAARCGTISAMSRAIAEQTGGTEAFVVQLKDRLERQCEDVGSMGEEIERVLQACADLERAFNQETAADPKLALADMSSLLHQLAGTATTHGRNMMVRTNDLLRDTERFNSALRTALSEVQAAQAELHDDVSAVVRDSERRCETVLRMSWGALSELQFQDPMAQNLREICRIAEKTRRYLDDALGHLQDTRLWGRGLSEPAQATFEDEAATSDTPKPPSGDVLLF